MKPHATETVMLPVVHPPDVSSLHLERQLAGLGTSTPAFRDTVVELVRQIRFAGQRPPCIHCGGSTYRWGRFSGRQRYRCNRCRRTFSDLSGTVLRNLKRLDACPSLLHCMARQASVRRTAQIAGISKDTAFRWRHRLLADRAAACEPGRQPTRPDVLAGQCGYSLALVEASLTESLKGKRPWPDEHLFRASRRRGVSAGRRIWARRAWLVSGVGRSQAGGKLACGMWSMWQGGTHPPAFRLADFLRETTNDSTVIGVTNGRQGRWGIAARRSSRSLRDLGPWRAGPVGGRGLIADRNHAGVLCMLFQAWLRPFRGVSTRRLPSYLGWHLLLLENPAGHVTGVRLLSGIRASGGKAGHLIRARMGEPFVAGAPLSSTQLLIRLLQAATE